MKKLIIFGIGKISDCVSYYFERDSDYVIEAYCCDGDYIKQDTFNDRPVVAFEDINKIYPSREFSIFIALGYHNLNKLRSSKYSEAIAKGYNLASYRSPYVLGDFSLGSNSMVLDGAVIQPKVKICSNVFVWGGVMIGHHAVINDHCWVTGGANVGGLSTIGASSFLGLNSTIGHGVNIGNDCLIGANTLITKNIAYESVVVMGDTETHRLRSGQFLRLTNCFR